MMTFDPASPRLPNGSRQHELIPQFEQLVGVHVKAHVVFGPLAQDLLVDARPVGAVVEVVAQGWAAPANVERKLDSPARPWAKRLTEIVWHSHKSCCGAELVSPRVRHP